MTTTKDVINKEVMLVQFEFLNYQIGSEYPIDFELEIKIGNGSSEEGVECKGAERMSLTIAADSLSDLKVLAPHQWMFTRNYKDFIITYDFS